MPSTNYSKVRDAVIRAVPEEWKPVTGFDGYMVSNTGYVRSIFRGRNSGKILKFNVIGHGYFQVQLSFNNKQKSFLVHRLVSQAFIPNKENLPCVNHKDGNKENNHVTNLEWCSYQENSLHAIKNGLWNQNRDKNGKYSKSILEGKGE